MQGPAVVRERGQEPSQARAALAGLTVLLVGIGIARFGYPPLIPALILAGWFDAAQAGYLGATNLAGYLVGAALAPRLALRFSATGLIRTALVAATLSLFACALPLGFAWYFAWRLISGIAGAVLMVLASPKVVAFAPVGRRGRVAGIVFVGVGFGIVLSGTLVPWLAHFGVPHAWLAFGIASAGLTASAWNGLPSSGERAHAAPDASAASARRPRGAEVTLPIVMLCVTYGGYGVGFVPHTVFWVDYIARHLGHGLVVGGGYWVLFGIAACGGPLLTGWCADRMGFARSYRYSLLANAAFVGLPLLSASSWALAVSSVGVGGLATAISSLALGRVAELVPLEQQRQVWGWMTIVFSVFYAGSGYLLSFLFARTGSYPLLFEFGAAALVAAFFLDWSTALIRSKAR